MLRAELLPRCGRRDAEHPRGRSPERPPHRVDRATRARRRIEIHQMGASAVVITGGHAPGDEIVDLLFDGEHVHRAADDAHRHAGTRTAPAARSRRRSRRTWRWAISLLDAVVRAQDYVARRDSARARHRPRPRTARSLLEDRREPDTAIDRADIGSVIGSGCVRSICTGSPDVRLQPPCA